MSPATTLSSAAKPSTKLSEYSTCALGGELLIPCLGKNLNPVAVHQLELVASISVGHRRCAHLLCRLTECIQTGAEGECRPGQNTTGIGLDIQLAPGHFTKGLPLTRPRHILTFQQILEQEGLNALVGRSFTNPYQYGDSKASFTDAVAKLRALI